MGKTANYNLPFPNPTDKANVPLDIQKLAEAAEAALGNKVTSEIGKRLMTNTEGEKLASLENYDDTELNEKIEEQATKIEELEEENKQLLKDYKPIPFNSSSNHLEDTGELPMPISINGGIEQDSRSGDNLYNVNDIRSKSDGVTIDSEGYITVSVDNTNGTSSIFKNIFSQLLNNLKPSTNYNIITEIKSVSGTGILQVSSSGAQIPDVKYNLADLTNNSIETKIVTSVSDFTNLTFGLRTYLHYVVGTSGSITFRISVLEDTTITSDKFVYEAFGQMPSLEFPSEVKGVSGHYDTVVENKQLFNIDTIVANKFIMPSNGKEIDSPSWNQSDYMKIKSNSNITISNDVLFGGGNNIEVSQYDKNKKWLKSEQTGPNDKNFITYKLLDNASYVRVGYRNDKGYTNIQVEHGDTRTTYNKEHQEQLLPIDIPFNMYSGKAYKENGKWYRDVEWAKEYLTASSTIYSGSTNTTGKSRFTFKPALPHKVATTSASIVKEIYCNILKNGSPDMSYLCRNCVTYDGNFIIIYLDVCSNMTWQEFRAFCEQNNVYVVYELATPIKEEITDTTLIAQLEELQKAHSYYEVTNINSYRASEDVTEMKLSGNALMSNDIRLSKLENAILSIGGNV